MTEAAEIAAIKSRLEVISDGTLDTVVRDSATGEEYRGIWDRTDEGTYEDFVEWFVDSVADDIYMLDEMSEQLMDDPDGQGVKDSKTH